MQPHNCWVRRASSVLAVGIAMCLAVEVPAQTTPPTGEMQAWAMGHADAKVLIGFDLKSLRESSAGKFMTSQLGSQLPPQAGPMGMFLPMALQALNDVDSIFISSPGELAAAKTGAKPVSPAQNPPFLIVLQGRFASSPLNFLKSGTPQPYKGAQIYQAPGGAKTNDAALAMLNDSTMIVGDAKSLRAAIDLHAQPNGGIPQGLRARAALLQKDHDFWVVVQDSLSKLQPGNAALAGPAAEIEGLEMGLGLRDGLLLDVNLAAKSEATVKMMAQMLEMQMQAALSSPKFDSPQAAEMAAKIKVTTEGKTLRMHLQLTQEELERQMRTMQTQRQLARTTETPGQESQTSPSKTSPSKSSPSQTQPSGPQIALTPASALVQPKPAAPRKIKILGLDDGPREIELK